MMEGWKTDKLKNYISVESGYAFKTEDFSTTGIPVVKIGNIVDNTTKPTNGDSYIRKEDLSLYENYIIREGDVLIAMSGNTTCKMGRVSKAFSPSLVNQRVGWIKPLNSEINIDFVYYLLQSESYQNKLWNYATATGQPNLSPRDICKINFYKPTLSEQTAIATILSKVDEAIASVQASISAAERLKKSLMQNLLTGRMKPDGTLRKEDEFYVDEKFGKVPLGWEVKKVKDLFYMNQNTLSSNTNADYRFKYITIEAVNTEKIEFENCPCYSFKDSPGRARRIIKDNDILISGVRPNLKAFAIYYKPDSNNWICSTGFHVLTAKEKVCPQFFFYQILSSIGASQFHSWVAGSNYPAIGDSDMKNMLLYTPPYEEQLVINQKFESISKSQKEKQSKIAVLERLKKSLMQNLLTGRVRILLNK